MERSQYMDGVLCCLHFHGLIQTTIQGRAVITSLVEYALSLCGVTSRDARRASRAPFPGPHHNQRVELRLCRQRVMQQHQKKLAWNNTSAQWTSYREPTCSLRAGIRFRS